MGLYIYSKAIHTETLKKVFGSKDQCLLDKIKESSAYQHFRSDDDTQSISIEKALTDMIFGYPYDEKSDHVYGYAFICLCDTLGQDVPFTQELKLGYETDLVTQYLESDFGLKNIQVENYLFNETFETGLPRIKEFPSIGLLPCNKLSNLLNILPDITISDDVLEELWDEDDDKACAYEHIKGLRKNLQFCFDQQMDLISFCH